MTLSVFLPWPSRALHPNSRTHFMVRARAAKKARADAAWAAREACLHTIEAEALHVTITFTPPDYRARDTDGMLASMKAALDGLADVIGVDDSRWSFTLRREPPAKPGSVRVEFATVEARAAA